MKKIFIPLILICGGLLIGLLSIIVVRSQIQQIAGLAVAQTSTQWNNLKDAAQGDNLTSGLMAAAIYGFDGTNFDRVRVNASGALNVNWSGSVTPSDAYANPTTAINTFALGGMYNGATWDRVRGDTTNGLWVNVKSTVSNTAGSSFYAVKRTNIAAVSANLAFGFTSKKVVVEVPASNTDEVCVNWIGGVASCPAANTAGNDRVSPGEIITLDEYAVTSISAIASSGTQSIYVRAWN